jgi:uncharacterized membrane protein YfcA
MWKPEWLQWTKKQAYICSIVLFFSGLLCSAGGIGGGGIYVTVLMVAGNLSVNEAVPLSKAVVFFGSISSLFLNMRKAFVREEGKTESLIDFNLCRIVVPGALFGTYFGVLFNQLFPDWVILSLLTLILLVMTFQMVRTTVRQCVEELPSEKEKSPGDEASSEGGDIPSTVASTPGKTSEPDLLQLRSTLRTQDVVLALIMLIFVIICSVFRIHASDCQAAKTSAELAAKCHHPSLFFLDPHTLTRWMHEDGTTKPQLLLLLSFIIPISLCVSVSVYYCRLLTRSEGWRMIEIAKYQSMSAMAGCLAGLVGIGGGLIFSPFFLLMNVEPSVAVATSSTCVIFTASSTTLQYLLTDRIIVSLTIMYGLVNLLASYAGTSFVHLLQDNYGTRRSYITAIVGLGVLISMVLSCIELWRSISGEINLEH